MTLSKTFNIWDKLVTCFELNLFRSVFYYKIEPTSISFGWLGKQKINPFLANTPILYLLKTQENKLIKEKLTLSWRRFLSYRNQPIDLQSKRWVSMVDYSIFMRMCFNGSSVDFNPFQPMHFRKLYSNKN